MERTNSVMNYPKLIVIQGPTASGKTKLAVELAKKLETIILSADSRQFYKEISIGTAKPTHEEMQGIRHYFIDSQVLTQELSASAFGRDARDLIINELSHFKYIIIVGGSGLFIQALCEGFDDIPHDAELQKQLTLEYQQNGLTNLLQELVKKDPDYYQKVDKNNSYRIIRAMEAMRLTGKTMTELRKGSKTSLFDDVHYFTLELPRDVLYKRINARVDEMIQKGLEDEARGIYELRYLKSLQTVGYREFFDYFDGKTNYEETVELIKQHSRNYAKRQITWFKKHHPGEILKWHDADFLKTILSIINY